MSEQPKLDFRSILGSSVDDMNASLTMLLQSIEQLDLADNLTPKQHQAVADLHYQTARIKGSLMQLLFLNNEQQPALVIASEKHCVSELLQEVIDRNRIYLNSHHVNVSLEVDAQLSASFDRKLVTDLIAEVFIHALRYSDKSVKLCAFSDEQYLNIQIEDDGQGYPQHMQTISQHTDLQFDASHGRSGLTVLLANKIAAGHSNKQRQGAVLLENKTESSGNLFTLRLPQ